MSKDCFFLKNMIYFKKMERGGEPVVTKYPIILAHGIFMKPRFFRVFKHIQRKLNKAGYHVYIADTDGVGDIENNSLQLKEQIEQILDKEGIDKINIIAHSKGGLESVYMIKNLEMGQRIASLTTLCTPYKGSAVATFVNRLPSFLLTAFVFCCNIFYRVLGDKKPNFRRALKELDVSCVSMLDDMEFFKEIYLQSYSCAMKNAMSDPVLAVSFLISTRDTKDFSDGMVSKSSAQYINYRGDCMDESISHNEIICYLTRRRKKRKVVEFYLSLCEELAKYGY